MKTIDPYFNLQQDTYGVDYVPRYIYHSTIAKQQRYRLIIDSELLEYMRQLAELSAPNEILGIGMLTKQIRGCYTDFIVDELFTPHQQVSAAFCTFADGAQNEIINEIISRGDNPVGLCFRWHSHVDGEVYFSPTDEADIDNCDSPYVVNLVINTHHDMVARLDILDPVRVRNIPLDIVVEIPKDNSMAEDCLNEILANCEQLPKGLFSQVKPPKRKRTSKQTPTLPKITIPKGVT